MTGVKLDTAPVAVELVDIFRGAVRVPAVDLEPGDAVFDTTGGRHELRTVRRLARGRVRTVRQDGWSDVWAAGDTVTVLRAGGAA